MGSEEKKLTPENKRTIYISVLMVVALSVVSFWRFKNIDFSEVTFSSPMSKSTETPSLQDMLSEEEIEKMMRESGFFPDKNEEITEYKRKEIEGKIKFDYPSSWGEIAAPESEKENIDLLFLAYSQGNVYPTTLSVLKIKAEDIDEVASIIKKETEGVKEIDIITEKEDVEHLLEIDYGSSGETDNFTKAKAIFADEHFYLFSLTFFERYLGEFSTIDYILSSVQIIK